MPHVRSISVGVWLTRGSRHEPEPCSGIAHFVEHMLFKGTATRSAEDIAQAIDSIGGQLDAFTAKEYASYYIKVLDEHLPLALDILSDIVLHPAFDPDDIEREKKVILEEIKMVEDTPDDLVHELFTQSFWEGHAARPADPRHAGDGGGPHRAGAARLLPRRLHREQLHHFGRGQPQHEQVRELVERAFAGDRARRGPGLRHARRGGAAVRRAYRRTSSRATSAWGPAATPQSHEDRYVSYVLNTLLGGSMSSRLFQNVREKRGLAYAVFSGLSAYRDAGALTIYAGCANEAVGEVIDLDGRGAAELKRTPPPGGGAAAGEGSPEGQPDAQPREHRQPHVAPGPPGDLLRPAVRPRRDAGGVERVTADDVQRVATELFANGALAGPCWDR